MTEYKMIELNQRDIVKLVAEKYDVEEQDVELEVYHGDPQYPQESVYVTVKVT